jgi:hypothetical protein
LAENLFVFFSLIAGGYDRRTEKKEVGALIKKQNTKHPHLLWRKS